MDENIPSPVPKRRSTCDRFELLGTDLSLYCASADEFLSDIMVKFNFRVFTGLRFRHSDFDDAFEIPHRRSVMCAISEAISTIPGVHLLRPSKNPAHVFYYPLTNEFVVGINPGKLWIPTSDFRLATSTERQQLFDSMKPSRSFLSFFEECSTFMFVRRKYLVKFMFTRGLIRRY